MKKRKMRIHEAYTSSPTTSFGFGLIVSDNLRRTGGGFLPYLQTCVNGGIKLPTEILNRN
ncbi:unnamed protein product [Dovyalis caffra]|uniref:Uncharacterized protein n=1 Tax=Dovyalis caffra TaxID=77055 RepID=A0AAV1RM53_9ROSI|nr:unnamed protein product [Dovyalis caffra]